MQSSLLFKEIFLYMHVSMWTKILMLQSPNSIQRLPLANISIAAESAVKMNGAEIAVLTAHSKPHQHQCYIYIKRGGSVIIAQWFLFWYFWPPLTFWSTPVDTTVATKYECLKEETSTNVWLGSSATKITLTNCWFQNVCPYVSLKTRLCRIYS